MVPVPVRCRIPELLKSKGKNQSWLADYTGLSRHRVSDYVLMKRIPSLPIGILIGKALGVHADELHIWDARQE